MKIQGTEYRVDCALLTGIDDDNRVFGQVKGIFILDGNRIVFAVTVFHTSIFSQHYHAYFVSKTHTHSPIPFLVM